MTAMEKNNKTLNVPHLRFPEFSGEWERSNLKRFATKITKKNKGNMCSNVLSNSANYGIIPQSDFFDRSIANSDNTDTYYVIEGGDFVYNPRKSTVAPYGPINVYEGTEVGIISPLYLCFKVEWINKKYLYHYFKSNKWHPYMYINGDSGARHDRVSIKDDVFLDMPLFVPSQKEQLKITLLLDAIDKRIETQKKIIEDLKRLKDAITHSHYRNELSHSPMVYIGQYITQVSKRNKDAKIDRVLSVSNKYGFINQDEQFEDREVASADTSNYKIVHKGDFAYNPARINVGSVARLQEFENGIVSPMYVCFTAKKGILPAYFELYLSTNIFKHEMNKRLEGSVRLCLTYESLCNIKIALPEFNIQKDFVSKVSTILTKIKAEERLLYLYQNCKQHLLTQLFI